MSDNPKKFPRISLLMNGIPYTMVCESLSPIDSGETHSSEQQFFPEQEPSVRTLEFRPLELLIMTSPTTANSFAQECHFTTPGSDLRQPTRGANTKNLGTWRILTFCVCECDLHLHNHIIHNLYLRKIFLELEWYIISEPEWTLLSHGLWSFP